MEVTLPAMIIISMNYDFSREIMWESGKILLLSLALFVISGLFAVYVTKFLQVDQRAASVYQFMLIFPNIGFMGYPVINAIFGKLGVFYTSIFNLSFSLVVWTLGVWLFQKNNGESMQFHWRVLLTPGIASTLLGFLIFLFSIKLPYPIHRTLELVGGVTTPMSMLVVGALMARSPIKAIWNNPKVYLMSAIRLLVIPLIVLGLMRLGGFATMTLGVTVVLLGMPGAANTAIFAERYRGDADLASRCVFLSTLFSVMTIPLMVWILKMFISW
jgi:predicted permease